MEKELISDFLRIMSRFRALKHVKHMEMGVHQGEYRMLLAISEFIRKQEKETLIGVKVGELAGYMCATRPAVSKMLNALEQKRMIERIVDKEDRRVIYIRLTQTGETCIKRAQKAMEAFTVKIIEQLGDQDVKDLIRVMERIFDIMQEEFNKA